MSSLFVQEILDQPDALLRTVAGFDVSRADLLRLRENLRDGTLDRVIITGMGGSYDSGYPLMLALTRGLSVPVLLWEASELAHHAAAAITDKTLLIGVSQSGESAELVRLTKLDRQPGVGLSVTNEGGSSLAQWADVAIFTHAGTEKTVSTKTYTTTVAAMHLLGTLLTGGDVAAAKQEIETVAEALRGWLNGWEAPIAAAGNILKDANALAIIGRGTSMASVHTATLILQESSKLVCGPFSGGGFRHGPVELIREGFYALMFAGNDATTPLNLNMAREITEKGGTVLVVAQEGIELPKSVHSLRIPAVPAAVLPVMEIVPVQLLTIPLAEVRGFQAATFQHTSKVTDIE